LKARFVTATGTGVGKTLVSAALIHQLRAAGQPVQALKPLLTGWPDPTGTPSDPELLLRAQGVEPTLERIAEITPWRFAAPLAPDMAAARERRALDFDALVAFTRAAQERCDGWLVVEGVGGVAVPLDDRHTVLDWIAGTKLPALLVTGSYLGTLSHTFTAAAALRAAGIPLAGLVISESAESPVPLEETRATLLRFLGELPCALLPRLTPGRDAWRHAPPLLDPLGMRS
jgi:dethiobiotin synthetase